MVILPENVEPATQTTDSTTEMADGENLPRCIKLDKNHVMLLNFVLEVGISKFKHVACLDSKNSARKQYQSSMHRRKGKES